MESCRYFFHRWFRIRFRDLGDAVQLLDAFNRGSDVSTVTVKLDNPANFEQFRQYFENDRRLNQFEPKREQQFFAEQSEGLQPS